MLKKIFIRNALILAIYYTLVQLVMLWTYDPGNFQSLGWIYTLITISSMAVMMYCCFSTHRLAYNENYLTWKSAYGLAFGVLILAYLVDYVISSLFFQIYLKNLQSKSSGIEGLISLFAGPQQPMLIPNFLYDLFTFQFRGFFYDLKFIIANPVFLGILALILVESRYLIFKRSNRNPLAALVPFYATWVLLEIIKKPKWWFLMLLIPLVNIYFYVMILHGLSLKLGRGTGFTFGLFFLPFIYYPILGFGELDRQIENVKIA